MDGAGTPALQAVRDAFALDRFKPVDYETVRFGRFDPALLAQARKRIAAATETLSLPWRAEIATRSNRQQINSAWFAIHCASSNPGSESLAVALTKTLDAITPHGQATIGRFGHGSGYIGAVTCKQPLKSWMPQMTR